MKALIPILALLTLVACEPRDKFGRTKAEREAYGYHIADSMYKVWSADSAAAARSDAFIDSIKSGLEHPE
jgi:hypothetical protein